MKKNFFLFLTLITIYLQSIGCTTAVISGKATKDGRPMIWKLRDSESFKNKLIYFEDGKYDYIGMVNANDAKGNEVWGGANEVGFAIMNSASFNVNLGDTTSIKDREGIFMKLALQQCETLEDFEQLMLHAKKPMGLASHFGVIDAQGGAAFYEVNNQTFTKFDANDEETFPEGYILRTNFSETGKKDVGYGFIRLETAKDLFADAEKHNQISYENLLTRFSRCFKHSLLKKDFRQLYEHKPKGDDFINSGDLITRHGSSSNIVIQGVKKGMPKDVATIWTHIGFPNTTLALPVWVKGGKKLPEVLTAKDTLNAPLNEMALQLKRQCYPITRSSGYKYLKISTLINQEKTGIVQKLEAIETKIFDKTNKLTQKKRMTKKEIQSHYQWLDNLVYQTYLQTFNLNQKHLK